MVNLHIKLYNSENVIFAVMIALSSSSPRIIAQFVIHNVHELL